MQLELFAILPRSEDGVAQDLLVRRTALSPPRWRAVRDVARSPGLQRLVGRMVGQDEPSTDVLVATETSESASGW